ncbi:MAG: LysR family transcriptional regulator [Rhodospirillaceae bacterium]
MDIRQLNHFVGVASHGSFTKAARGLNISQPALTRSVHLLEDALGVALFDRTPQGVELTKHGDTLYRHATLILNSVQTAKKEIQATKDGGWGEVRVGIASLFSNFLVDQAVSNAARYNLSFQASVKVGLFEDMAAQLDEGSIDMIVTTRDETIDLRQINFEDLCETSSVLVAGAANPIVRKKFVKLEQLADEPWVVLNHPLMESFLVTYFAQSGLSTPANRVRTSSLNMLRSLIRQQYFIGFLPTHWIKDDLKSGVLSVVKAPNMPFISTAGIATRQSALLNKSAQLLVDKLRAAASVLGS